MSSRDYSKYGSNISFIDMLFALLIGVFSIFIISMLLLGDPKKNQDDKKIQEKSQLLISMTWSETNSDDMDLWILAPNGDKINYKRRENGFISLDRDDLGVANDFVIVNGEKKLIRHNEEIARVRMMQSGHYVVNVVFFERKQDPETNFFSIGPNDVTITLLKVNPDYHLVFANTISVDEKQQVTAFAFDVSEDGTIDNITTDQVPFVGNENMGLPDQQRLDDEEPI